jgi:hypothetical protein
MTSMDEIVGRSFSRGILFLLLAGISGPLGAQLVWEPLADECGTVRSVLCPSEPWENGCVWAPTILRDEEDGLYRMWYNDCSGQSIGHAWSPDGLEWEKDPANPVINGAWLPTVLLETGDVRAHLLDQAAVEQAGRIFKGWASAYPNILYAESLDGTHWTASGSAVLSPGPSNAWDDLQILFSRVFFDERIGRYHMWYGAFGDPGISRTGHATSADGINWVRDPADGPVIDSESAWDSLWLFPNNVVFDETRGLFEMLYSGRPSAADPWNHAHHATSPDGISWTKHPLNPVRGLGDLPSGGIGYPAVMFDKSTNLYRMWFDDLTPCIHHATSPRTAGDLPARAVSLPGDPEACPPKSSGTIDVTISQALGGASAGENVTVREKVSGPVGPAAVAAGNGGQVQALPQTPVAPVGMFQDSRLVLTKPDCAGQAGEWYATHDPAADAYTLGNVGEDIWAVGDTFTFAYSRVEGDFTFTTHIAGRRFVPGSRWGKHGVMARQDLSNRSRYSFMHDQGEDLQDATRWASRPTHGGADNYETIVLAPGEHHDWLRIERVGDVFTGYSSFDGSAWVLNGTQTWNLAPDTVLVGLAAMSHTTDCCQEPMEIVFDQVDLELGTGAEVSPLGALDPLGVEITWSTTRGALASGLSYEVLLPEGYLALEGTAGGTPVFGDGAAVSRAPPVEHGPITLGGRTLNAHMVGPDCPDARAESCGAGCISMAGPGADIWRAGDHFLFAYEEVTGDFSASVSITGREFPPGSRWGKHGVMVREDCGERSRYSFIHDNAEDLQDATRFAYRRTHGGADNLEVLGPIPAGTHFDALRLDRCGSVFVGYVRDEQDVLGRAGEWVEVGRHDWGEGAPATVRLGLAVNSHTGCTPATVFFEDWEVLPYCDGPVEDLQCTPNASGGLDLTWTLRPGAPEGPIGIEVNDDKVAEVPGDSTSATLEKSALPLNQVLRIDVVNSSRIAATCAHPPEVTARGFVRKWLVLGPLASPGGAAPGDVEIAYDYLTDGTTTEANIRPRAGLQVMPDYYDPTDGSGLAASTGLVATPGRPDINSGGIATWFEHADGDDTIDFADVFKGDINNVMCYAAAYIDVTGDTTVDIGLGSDDSIQVLVDGTQVHLNNVPRSFGATNEVQDYVRGVSLPAGCHLLLVKVFDGNGQHGFRLRIQDPVTEDPALPGRIGLSGCAGELPSFLRGDADSSGEVNLTDAIRVLNVLFLGIGEILCADAADSDDSGDVNLTDAIRILNVLFLGLGTIPVPGIEACGPDPTEDDLAACAEGSC